MNSHLRQFIEENIGLIETEMYDELYYQARVPGSPLKYSGCGGLTQCLHKVDIYPEYHFKELPESFLAQAPEVIPNYIIPDNVQKISKNFGWRSNIQTLTIGKNVLELAEDSLCDINDLKYIEIPESVQIIGKSALCLNYSLEHLIFKCQIYEIPEYCCLHDRSLKNVILPKMLDNIRSSAFQDCSALDNIVIPNTVASIEAKAFFRCYNLHKIQYEGTVNDWNHVTISGDTFYKVPARTITCSDGITKLRH